MKMNKLLHPDYNKLFKSTSTVIIQEVIFFKSELSYEMKNPDNFNNITRVNVYKKTTGISKFKFDGVIPKTSPRMLCEFAIYDDKLSFLVIQHNESDWTINEVDNGAISKFNGKLNRMDADFFNGRIIVMFDDDYSFHFLKFKEAVNRN